MDTSLTLLGLLGVDSGYGYDLKHHYDRWFGSSKPLAFGQVYATLARLVRDGLISVVGAETGFGRPVLCVVVAGEFGGSGFAFAVDAAAV